MTSKGFARIIGNHEFSIFSCDGLADIIQQPINKKTGLPWQAKRTVRRFEGPLSLIQARIAFMKMVRDK